MSALPAAVAALSELARRLLEALAVYEDTITQTKAGKLLAALGVRITGLKPNVSLVRPHLDALVDAGLATQSGRYQIAPEMVEPTVRRLRQEGRYETIAAAVHEVTQLDPRRLRWGKQDGLRCALRRRLYSGDTRGFIDLYESARRVSTANRRPPPDLTAWVTDPLDTALIHELPPDLSVILLNQLALLQFSTMEPIDGLASLVDTCHRAAPRHTGLCAAALHQALLAGQLDRAATIGGAPKDKQILALHGLEALIRGDVQASAKHYARSRAAYKKACFSHVPGVEGLFLPLAYLLQGSATRRKQAKTLLQELGTKWMWKLERPEQGYYPLLNLSRILDGDEPEDGLECLHPASVLLEGLVGYWSDTPVDDRWLHEAAERAGACGYRWLAGELVALTGGEAVPGLAPLLRLREPAPEWARKLELIEQALGPAAPSPPERSDAREARVAWLLHVGPGWTHLEAREQVPRGKSGWSKGRKVASERLLRDPESVQGLGEHDRRILACLRSETRRTWRGYPETDYHWDELAIWAALAGHPAIFDLDQPERRLEIAQRSPQLVVTPTGAHLTLRVDPSPPDHGGAVVSREGDRFEAVTYSEVQRRVAELLGDGIQVPARAERRLGALLSKLAGAFPVHDRAALLAADATEVDADTRPTVQLTPTGAGLAARLLVKPLGEGGPACTPGEGAASVLAQIDGEVRRARRRLEAERQRAAALLERAPTLTAALEGGEPGLEGALTLLTELQAAGDAVLVEWPEGQALRLRRAVDFPDLSLRLKGEADWFSASGKLTVDESMVLQLSELLALVESSPSRFVKLKGGDFLALSEKLRAQLDALARLSRRSGREARFHKLAAAAVAPLVSSAGKRRTDKRWKAQLERLEAIGADAEPPRTLQAELRPYQRDGFTWLARLAALGAGACLADDMGLGKTVQALALLLHRATEGPALVVAPTSVCGVWVREAWRFAPSLKVLRFGAGDREKMLAGLGAADLVICSYGLLQTETERLAAIQWSAVVLDEAQAIKNPETKRHKAAVALKADFRLVTTGTPVENHLGDLWALFAFLNPGLLGSKDSFRRRYAEPIEGGSREVQAQLRRLVLPFILRRVKSAVLDDLPPRIDIEIPVVPGPEEAALYEALRRRAVEALGDGEEAQPMQVLAWLTRLRLACCNPRLAIEGDQAAPPSAKLEAFAEIVEGLRDSQHRALVFSQFVKHLTLLRRWLDERGLPYLYLDGSTPAAERDRRVRAFQSGEGDLFLISLKAGGTGLNLTGADYVVHMDPWWNPAVEDQASDRAHRIGQTRPVTVYRLVAQGTIEEKILALHRQKRDLADRLLEGADTSSRLTAQALLALIRER